MEKDIKDKMIRLGNVYGDKFNGMNFGGNVWDKQGLAPTLKTGSSASQQCIVEVKRHDGQNQGKKGSEQQIIRLGNAYDDRYGTSFAGNVYDPKGISSTLQSRDYKDPKLIVDIRQATKEGFIPCEVGGGGRPELSGQQNTQRKGNKQRTDMSDSDNGEYP